MMSTNLMIEFYVDFLLSVSSFILISIVMTNEVVLIKRWKDKPPDRRSMDLQYCVTMILETSEFDYACFYFDKLKSKTYLLTFLSYSLSLIVYFF